MLQTAMEASVVLAVRFPYRKHAERFDDTMKNALTDLAENSGKLAFPLDANITVYPRIAVLQSRQAKRAAGTSLGIANSNLHEFIRIDARVPPIPVESSDEAVDANSIPLQESLVRELFSKRIEDLIVASNLAYPGAVGIAAGEVNINGRTTDSLDRFEVYMLREACLHSEKIKWPTIGEIPLTTVWSWLLQCEGFLDGFGGGSVGRALNAFTRLFPGSGVEPPIGLFWSLVGIEALYVEGKNSIMEQVRDKARALLGEPQEFKRALTRMYDLRSRFVHGALDFPGAYLLNDATDEVARYDRDVFEAEGVAPSLLVATIQTLILRDWGGLRFGITISNSD
jgi:hypothetical protein